MAAKKKLTHLDDKGHATMVDVSQKEVTARSATAKGRIDTSTERPSAASWPKAMHWKWRGWRASWQRKKLPISFRCAIR